MRVLVFEGTVLVFELGLVQLIAKITVSTKSILRTTTTVHMLVHDTRVGVVCRAISTGAYLVYGMGTALRS